MTLTNIQKEVIVIIWMPDNVEIDSHLVTIEISSDTNKAKLKIISISP
jgi:hypothetical protein